MSILRAALHPAPPTSLARSIGRVAFGVAIAAAGITHLTIARQDFRAQVPPWLPADPDAVVLASGIAEIALGGAVAVLRPWRVPIGWLAAGFFVAVFPGNIAQYAEHRDAFGLDSDAKRLARLPFQVPLVLAALWTTAAWRDRRRLTR